MASLAEILAEGERLGKESRLWAVRFGDIVMRGSDEEARRVVVGVADVLPRLLAVAKAAVEMRAAETDHPESMDVPYPTGPLVVHCYGCPATKVVSRGKSCNCGGAALQARIAASRAAFDSAVRGEGGEANG